MVENNERERITITLPIRTLEKLKRQVPKRKRSHFIEDLLKKNLQANVEIKIGPKTQQVLVTLDKEIFKKLKSLVPDGKRSYFIASLIESELEV